MSERVEVIHDLTDWCGIYIRSLMLDKAGDRAEQHVHSYDHPTLCASGRAEFWEDGKRVGEVKAGEVAKVRAGLAHYFVALEDATRLACIHDARSAMEQKEI